MKLSFLLLIPFVCASWGPFDFIPVYETTIRPGNVSVWSNDCWGKITAQFVEFDSYGFKLVIDGVVKHNLYCSDTFTLQTGLGSLETWFHDLFFEGNVTHSKKWNSYNEYLDVSHSGARLYRWPLGIIGTALHGFNSIEPYDWMNQKCRIQPPDYLRQPDGC